MLVYLLSVPLCSSCLDALQCYFRHSDMLMITLYGINSPREELKGIERWQASYRWIFTQNLDELKLIKLYRVNFYPT